MKKSNLSAPVKAGVMESAKGQTPKKVKIFDLAERRIIDRELVGVKRT